METLTKKMATILAVDWLDVISRWFRRNAKKIVPYAIIILASFFMVVITFDPGYYEGHDTVFHHAQVWSYFQSLTAGDFVGYIAPGIENNFGASVRMFYSTLSQTVTALIGVLIAPFGLTLTTAFKIVNFLSFVFSGIFAYRLGLALFKGHVNLSILLGLFYLSNPYKIVVVYVRQAYAENFAAIFIPLFIMAIYQILEQDPAKITPRPYIILALATSAMLLSHYITALYAVFFGALYVLLRFRKIYDRLNRPAFYCYFAGAVISVLILFLPHLIPLIVQNNPDVNLRLFMNVQGTSYENIAGETERSFAFFITGFNDKAFYAAFFYLGLGTFVAAAVKLIFPKNKVWPALILGAGTALDAFWLYRVPRAPIHAVIIALLGIFIGYSMYRFDNSKKKMKKVRNYELLVWLLLSVLTVTMLFSKDIWKIFPSVFYQIQFPFRLWTFFTLFIEIFLLLLFHKGLEANLSVKYALPFFMVFAVSCTTVLDHWITNAYGPDNTVENSNHDDVAAGGWQREYLNDYFVDQYQRNGNPQYQEMYKWFINQSYEHDYIPYLIGRGTVADYSYTATDGADFTLSDLPQETVTVIMPLFYFEGYRVSVQTPTATKHPKVYQLDGLVAFDVEEAGTVSVDFTGTHSMQIGLKITELFVCFSAVTAAVYYAWYRPRKKLKDKVNPVSYRR